MRIYVGQVVDNVQLSINWIINYALEDKLEDKFIIIATIILCLTSLTCSQNLSGKKEVPSHCIEEYSMALPFHT